MPGFTFKQFAVEHHRSSMKVGTDAVLLAAVADVSDCNTILDVGTGCGVIALSMAQKSLAKVSAIDVHQASVSEAQNNFNQSMWADRLQAYQISFQDLAEQWDHTFDVIISNPPFFQNALACPDPDRHVARHNVALPFRDFAAASEKLLSENGLVWVVLPVPESILFAKWMKHYGFSICYAMNVYPKPNKECNRRILAFSATNQPIKCQEREVIIRNDDNSFTSYYKELTKEFYLDF